MKRFPFSIGFQVRGDTVRVVTVAHAIRLAGYWSGRDRFQERCLVPGDGVEPPTRGFSVPVPEGLKLARPQVKLRLVR